MSPFRYRPTAPALAALLALCGAACSDEPAVDSAAVGGGGAGAAAGGSSPSYHGSVQGTVHDEGGAPLAALGVTLCSDVCLVTETDPSGVFLFEGVAPRAQVVESIGYPGPDLAASAQSYTRFFDIVDVALDEQIVIARPFVMRATVSPAGPLSGPQQLILDGGLEVGFDADLFGVPGNPVPSPAVELFLGAVEIAEADWPRGGLDGWTILRAWGLAVWDLESDDAFEVVAPLGAAGPLPAGSEVAFLVADYTHGFLHGVFFEEAAELSADGMAIQTPATGGIDRATMWLAVTRN
jgi:hypothetical protein